MGGNEIDNLLFNYFYCEIKKYRDKHKYKLKNDDIRNILKIKRIIESCKCKLSADGASEVLF